MSPWSGPKSKRMPHVLPGAHDERPSRSGVADVGRNVGRPAPVQSGVVIETPWWWLTPCSQTASRQVRSARPTADSLCG